MFAHKNLPKNNSIKIIQLLLSKNILNSRQMIRYRFHHGQIDLRHADFRKEKHTHQPGRTAKGR
jgi:hypothetical protein